MTRSWFKMLKSSALPALALGAVLALTSPASAAMRGGGGHAGFGGGGHAVEGRGFAGGGARGFAGGERGFVGHGPAVIDRGHEVYRGGGYWGGGYRGGYWGGPAIGLGFGVGPGYYSSGCGYYDQAGYWHANPACYAPGAYGYGY